MQKRFSGKSSKYSDSWSDTEVEVRKSNDNFDKFEDLRQCLIGDGFRKVFSPPSKSPLKIFKPVSIREEVKIDLHKSTPCSTPSVRSTCKIYPIEELSENASRISIKSRNEPSQRQKEVQRIIEDRQKYLKERPKSRKMMKKSSLTQVTHEIGLLKTFYESQESIMDPAFVETSKQMIPERQHKDHFTEPPSPFDSISSFKQAQIHRFSNDVIEFHNHRQKSASSNDLMSLRTYSSYYTQGTSTSCFGCFFKPIAQLCCKSSKKKK